MLQCFFIFRFFFFQFEQKVFFNVLIKHIIFCFVIPFLD